MYGTSNPKYSDGANKKNKPMLMTVSADGRSSHYYYCPYTSCSTDNYVFKSIKKCEKRSNGSPCFLFASKRYIKWKNSKNIKSTKIPKKLLKEPYEIAKMIQELGFYNGNIIELPGIDYKTGNIVDEKKITGKIDSFDYPLLIASLTPSHKSDWREYISGGDEKYKAWFMAKRKDNDMTWGWQKNNTSWDDVEKKAFNRCNKYLTQSPKDYLNNTICVLYYKGSRPTTDDEKINTAMKFYNKNKVNNFFEKNFYMLDNPNFNSKKYQDESQSIKKSDIVSQLQDLKNLLDEGALSEEEFELAKKKLLN